MNNADLNWITNYIWSIADHILRDLYVRRKYRDVILPMTVLRRLDAVLEGRKQAVLDMKASLDKAGVIEQDKALRRAKRSTMPRRSRFAISAPAPIRNISGRVSRRSPMTLQLTGRSMTQEESQ